MTNLLICGSRDATPAMLDYARRCVSRAKERGFYVIVGDAAGVDTAVAIACINECVPFTIYGITETARSERAITRATLPPDPLPYIKCKGNFHARDRYMVAIADMVIGVWNGVSGGTKYTCEHALKLNRETYLIDMSKGETP